MVTITNAMRVRLLLCMTIARISPTMCEATFLAAYPLVRYFTDAWAKPQLSPLMEKPKLLRRKEAALTCLAWSKGCLAWHPRQSISVDTNYEKWDGVVSGERGQTTGLPSFFL